MSRVNTILAAWAVLFGLEFVSLGLATNATFSWTNEYIPPLQMDSSHIATGDIKSDFPATDGGLVLESYGERTPQSGVFLTTKENLWISIRRFVDSSLCSRIILAPKVPRYVSKSVLNL